MTPTLNSDFLPVGVPTFIVALMAFAALAFRTIVCASRKREIPAGLFAVARVFSAVLLSWSAIQFLARVLILSSVTPVWLMSLILGGGIELTHYFYLRESRIVSPLLARTLRGLRQFALLIVALMLMQPVLLRTVERKIERRIAVLLDTSASMRFVDEGWTTGERLALARNSELVEDHRRTIVALDAFEENLEELAPWLDSRFEGAPPTRAMKSSIASTFRTCRALRRQLGDLPAPYATNAVFSAASLMLDETFMPLLSALRTAPDRVAIASGQLLRLRAASERMKKSTAEMRLAQDEMIWEGLDALAKTNVINYSRATRLELAERILFGGKKPLLEQLAKRYDPEFIHIARDVRRAPKEAITDFEFVALAADFLENASSTNAPASSPVAADFLENASSTNAPASSPLAADFSAETSATNEVAEISAANVIAFPATNDVFSAATDITRALETIAETIPSEALAGVLLISDGLHNGDSAPDSIARRLGARDVPISTLLVGSQTPPFDLAIADINAPESIFLGDKLRVNATISATGARGKEAHVRLVANGETVDETTIAISEDELRRDIRLVYTPETNGIASCELVIDGLEGEKFPSNNTWRVDAAVSDDRTHVLIIDDYPRWDFRYLRNLFFARDKSVHLQYVLQHPDTILGVTPTNPPPAASASRPFGEAEAGALPENAEEWKKFDVIIVGDVGPEYLDNVAQSNIYECVEKRGALFVAVAGPRAMPHAYAKDSSPLAKLLPVKISNTNDFWTPPESAFGIALTAAGRAHPITQLSSSQSDNERIWRTLPNFSWRLPFDELSAGAEVLAFAKPTDDLSAESAANITAKNALEKMEAERKLRESRALVVAQNFGRGKVLALNTDQSWRLRYRVGDTLHHRFWGEILRWGLGERLRGGTSRFRVGTDRITYTPTDPVKIFARVQDENFKGIAGASVWATISSTETNNAEKLRIPLKYRADSEGIYEAALPPFAKVGAYNVLLERTDRKAPEDAKRAETQLLVISARRPIEMARVAASRETPEVMARNSRGKVFTPAQLAEITQAFGEESRIVTEPLEIALWDRPWLFLVLLAALTAEWCLRKRNGLV